MKQSNDVMPDLLDANDPVAQQDVLWIAGRPTAVEPSGPDVVLTVPFQAQKGLSCVPDAGRPRRAAPVRLRACGPSVIRITLEFDGRPAGDDSPMLAPNDAVRTEPLRAVARQDGWDVLDGQNRLRASLRTAAAPVRKWSDLLPPPQEMLELTVFPDGQTPVPLASYDQFFPEKIESFALAWVEREGQPHRVVFALRAEPNEHFAGTGERFARMDLAGRTLTLENNDALGVNNRRAYKNVPFYVSSRPYGLFIHTSRHVRLSLADLSTRAAQGLVEVPALDLFVIGGSSLERILYHYRCLTGFPPEVPLWSYGTWMSRMTYFSADEVRTVVRRLREGGFPCDVIHLDTGWFARDWICEWEFSPERFPDPAGFMAEMRRQGIRISLWQTPNIAETNKLRKTAEANRYIAVQTRRGGAASDFSVQAVTGVIDFTNPEAVRWYQDLLEKLLRMGAGAIKTDFGENIPMEAQYMNLPAAELHNLYALLYQRAAFEITARVAGQGLIWARAGWAGCHRYPVHWGGDAAATWDGLAGSLRGGLHLGLSGFGYWSHDVPGFHGLPDFMNSWPGNELYVRWTQFGVFSSHLRYHGTSPREPYEYPEIADTVRKWLKLRYALIPYLADQGRKTSQSGFPVLRAMVLQHPDDPLCWHLDDQYFCGDAFLVAPVMNAEGVRDVYLPAGKWVDFWDGSVLRGGRWLRGVRSPLDRLPVFAAHGSRIRVYPEPVDSTDAMDLSRSVELAFDDSYTGIQDCVLGALCGF